MGILPLNSISFLCFSFLIQIILLIPLLNWLYIIPHPSFIIFACFFSALEQKLSCFLHLSNSNETTLSDAKPSTKKSSKLINNNIGKNRKLYTVSSVWTSVFVQHWAIDVFYNRNTNFATCKKSKITAHPVLLKKSPYWQVKRLGEK